MYTYLEKESAKLVQTHGNMYNFGFTATGKKSAVMQEEIGKWGESYYKIMLYYICISILFR